MDDQQNPDNQLGHTAANPPPTPLNYGTPKPATGWSILRIFLIVIGIIILTGALAFGICTLIVVYHK